METRPVMPQASAEIGTYLFSPRELQRLAVYRAAVVARFYNDQCDSSDAAGWARSYEKVLSARSQTDTN
ncbi:MAG TPA: hypothetical protein VGJ60_34730 [Chloroflexota bacterium]|jgi:hypothetical protein